MLQTLMIIQLIVGILLIAAIMLQQKGAGLGAGFGIGGGGIVSSKRGVDLFLHRVSIILSILFFALGIAMMVI